MKRSRSQLSRLLAVTIGCFASTVASAHAATTTSVTANPNPSVPGQLVNLNATVSGASSGTVQFQIDGTDYGAPVTWNGAYAGLSVSSMSPGTHTISAIFDRGAPDMSSGSISHTVNPHPVSVGVTGGDPNATPGEDLTFTASVSGYSPTGAVQFVIDGQNAGPPVSLSAVNSFMGTARYSTSSLTPGQHQVVASYPGDANNAAGSSPPLTQSVPAAVSQAPTTTAVVCAGAGHPHPGTPLTCTATVQAGGTNGAPTGTVDFTTNQPGSFGSSSASSGVCQLTPGPKAGTASCGTVFTPNHAATYLITASYHPDTQVFGPSVGGVDLYVTHTRSGSSGGPPAVSGFGLTRRSFVVASTHTHSSTGVGTVFLYTLSVPARVRIAIVALLPGRRRNGACVSASAAPPNAGRCTRLVVIGVLTMSGHQGANRTPFAGHVGAKTLGAGRYRATITVKASSGRVSPAKTLGFTVVR